MKKLLITFSFITFVFCGIQFNFAQTVGETSNRQDSDVIITEKPIPEYTNAALQNSVEGKITARVTFKADGTIGKVFLLSYLPNGLNQKAIEAAKKIKFFPAMKNNVPITVTREVEFIFALTGKGFGSGTGEGSGDSVSVGRGKGQGSGSGNGDFDAVGNGTGNVTNSTTTPRNNNSNSKRITSALKITSKPSPSYTKEARENNVQGTITLRVTFNANGTIGSVTPVNSLPYGLTEQAISAARRITFQPAMKNGVPYRVVKQVTFSFTIY